MTSDEWEDVPANDGWEDIPATLPQGRTWTRAIAENVAPLISSRSNAVDALEGALLQQQNEIGGVSRAFMNGYTSGFGDEALAVGDGNLANQYRAELKDFATKNPVLNMMANVGGGVISPINKIAMIGKIPYVSEVAGALPGYARAALNVGTQAAIQGAGEGEGGIGNRVASGVVAAPFAAALGAGGSKLADVVTSPTGFSPIIKKIAELTGYDAPSREMVEQAALRMEDAGKAEIPGYAVIDALQPAYIEGMPTSKSTLGAYARGATKGSMGDGGMADAHTLIYSRVPSMRKATEDVLDGIQKGVDPETAIRTVADAAESAVGTAKQGREIAANYAELYKTYPSISKETAEKLVEIPYVKGFLQQERKFYSGADDLLENPKDLATKTWVKVRSRINEDIGKARAANDGNLVSDLMNVKGLLTDALTKETKGQFLEHNDIYAAISRKLKPLLDEQGRGIIQQLAKASDNGGFALAAGDDGTGAVNRATFGRVWGNGKNASINNIRRVEQYLGNDANRTGFRLASSDMLSDNKFTDNAKRLLASEKWGQQAQEILGSQDAKDLTKKLNYLHTIADNNAYLTGNSSTASELMSAGQDAAEILKPKLNPLNWLAQAIGEARGRAARDTRNTMMQTLLKQGDEGQAVLDDVMRYMDQAQLYRDRMEPARQVGLSIGRQVGPADILEIIKSMAGR